MRIKILFTSCLLLLAFQISYSQCEVLVWSDEFEGTGAPNSLYWNYDLGNNNGWGNNEVQNYTNSTTNVRQEGGKLIIDAIKTGGNWTSGRIKTQNKMTFTYGKVVFRAKLPAGGGTWPALWMLGQNITSVPWPDCGEIDVMEHVGNNLNRVQSALHTRSSFGNTQNVMGITVPTATTEFHDYAVSWNANRIAFSVDGNVFYTYAPTNKTVQNYPFTADQFLIMNIAMGGNLGGAINPSLTSARMEVEYVRLYEERTAPSITGPRFVYEDQNNLQFTAPDYPNGVTYEWVTPAGAEIVSGQGTKQVTVNWGDADGVLGLNLTGDTGCTNNSATLNVTTIIEPTGARYLAHSFAANNVTGWTKNGTDVNFSATGEKLVVNYNTSELRYIQYELPKAVDIQNYSIIKLPISIPTSSTSVPDIIMTFRDGNGNETISTSYELNASEKDGVTRIYTKNFNNQWSQNTPPVNPNFIKYVKIYVLPGQGSFSLDDIYFYNNQTIPAQPTGLAAETNDNQVTLSWEDVSNATAFHIYRSDSENGTYARVRSNLATAENPILISPTTGVNYYKVSGINAVGESAQSTAIEAIVNITGTENPLASISLYPNPSKGKFSIDLNDQRIDRINIYDLNGRSLSFKTQTEPNLMHVELNHAQPGIYFMRLIQNNKSRVYKLILE